MKKSKRAQLAIFVIIALVIVAGVGGFVLLKDRIFKTTVPAEYAPIYDYYLSCLKAGAEDGIGILGTQAGYIDPPSFEPGSQHAPFSNQLEFMGFGIPYWYYVSGNGVIKEQIPSKREMQNQLGGYIAGKLAECDFTEFRRQGYFVQLGDASASTQISDDKISINAKQQLTISNPSSESSESAVISNHKLDVDSNLGAFYDKAAEIYDYEKKNMFLENYAVDVLNLYAPVTGTELSCKPLVWNPSDVIKKVQNALAANIGAVHPAETETKDYFAVDIGKSADSESAAKSSARFLYSPDWVSRFEVWPTKSGIMMANIVGPEQGLGAAGFCYVSYKFVYDMYFPVLVQVYNSDNAEEVFQFPVAVVVSKNQPREALATTPLVESEESICDTSNSELAIYTYNTHLEPVEAEISFQCMSDVCALGATNKSSGGQAVLEAKVPQCVNGILKAEAEGYKTAEQYISTDAETLADVILSREYSLALEIYVDGSLTKNMAIVAVSENAAGADDSGQLAASAAYPSNAEISLSDGDYKFELKVYKDGKITIPESTRRECVDAPKSGMLGVLGITEEKCFDYTMPSQTVSNLLYAGGKTSKYVTQSELESAKKIKIFANSVALPSSADKLQETYNLVEGSEVRVELA